MDEIVKNRAMLLIEDSPTRHKIAGALEKLSYKSLIIPSITDETLERLKRISYKLIVIEDGFQNIPFRKNPIYRQIIRMNMGLRRGIFLALLTKEIKHQASIEAFSMSVNLLLDVEKMKEEELVTLFQQEISKYFQRYQMYAMVRKQINQGGNFL